MSALIYAALSGTSAGDHLAPALAASAAFLALSAIAATRVVSRPQQSAVALAVTLRDFAVAATLATQAFGTQAATVAGIFGVLMLITRRSAPRVREVTASAPELHESSSQRPARPRTGTTRPYAGGRATSVTRAIHWRVARGDRRRATARC